MREYAASMPWLHVVVPALLVTTGVAAGATALVTADPPSASAVWVDAPFGDVVRSTGSVTVVAHAASTSRIDSLVLLADDAVVAEDTSLDRDGSLVEASFAWNPSPGTYGLAVRQVGGTGAESETHYVTVLDGGQVAEPEPTEEPLEPEPTPEPTEELIDPDLDPGPSAGPDPEPEGPRIGPVSFGGPARVSWRAACEDTVDVYATITGAEQAYISIRGLTRITMYTARGEQWSGTIGSGHDFSRIGTYDVFVVANGDGVTIEKRVGRLSVEEGCID